MTKISNAGSNIWNLLEQPAVGKSEDRKQIRDVVPELKGRQIKTDSLELSREGMAALREKAAATYAEQRKNGNYVNATKQALNYLNEDAAFSSAMHQLFSNISPMTFR